MFLVASVNKKSLKKVVKLSGELVELTPVQAKTIKSAENLFNKEFPAQQLIVVLPVEALKNKIKVLEQMTEKT